MDLNIRSRVRHYMTQRLRMKGDGAALADEDSLFSSGRLDSLDAVETIMFVESEYGIDFAQIDFDLTLLDSVLAIADLIDRRPGHAP